MSKDSLFGIDPRGHQLWSNPETAATLTYEHCIKELADGVEGFPHLMAAVQDLFPKCVDDVKAELERRKTTQQVGDK